MIRRLTVFLFFFASVSVACTGFAAYAGEPWYGMNFDYPPDSEIRFNVSQWGDRTVFTMSFFNNEMGIWIPTVAMNDAGFFASLQYQCPMIEGVSDPEANQRYVWQLFQTAITNFSSVQEVELFLQEYQLVNLFDLTLHILVADTHGNALIAEAGNENLVTRIEDQWIVMTNFKVADERDTPLEEISGVGDDRYRSALSHIEEYHSSFDLQFAMGTLEAAVNTDEIWGTEASMVFRPTSGLVYLCIDGDFQHVWRVSMEDRRISTFNGFHLEESSDLDDGGISATELQTWL